METDTKAMSLMQCVNQKCRENGWDSWDHFREKQPQHDAQMTIFIMGVELYKDSCLAAQKAELEELKEAKRQYYELWNPVDEFVRNHPDTKLGDSVSAKALEMLKSITK